MQLVGMRTLCAQLPARVNACTALAICATAAKVGVAACHAATQVLQDSQGAIELATKQHAQVLKQVMATSKATVAAVQSVAKACNGTVRESVTAFNRDLAALRAKAGIKG